MKLLPLSQLATNESRVLEFEARSLSIHQPKLMLLGEGLPVSLCFLFFAVIDTPFRVISATPPISWLGAQNLKFPAWVHSGVTVPLEELLVGLSATFVMHLHFGAVFNCSPSFPFVHRYQGQLARQTLAKRPINRT